MKRFISLLLATVTIFGTTSVYAGDNMRFVYNSKEVTVKNDALNKYGKIFVPVDAIKFANVKVIEKSSNNSITIEALGKPGYASVWIGKTKGRINSQNITLSVAPFRENGVVYLPSDFVEDCLGIKIGYDKDKNTVYMDSVKERKLTSTAYMNNVAKNTKSSSKSTKSTGSTKTATSDTDFGAITGRTCTSSGNGVYVYDGATSRDLRKYVETLVSKGYSAKYKQGGQLFVTMDTYELTKGSSKITVVLEGKTSYSTSSYLSGNTNATSSINQSSKITVTYN